MPKINETLKLKNPRNVFLIATPLMDGHDIESIGTNYEEISMCVYQLYKQCVCLQISFVNTPCLKINCTNCLCQNFVKCPSILMCQKLVVDLVRNKPKPV